VIGDRAYGSDPQRVARLGGAVCDGLLEGGVLPVVKHMPGHGRASVDSHHACPSVETGFEELANTDFAPFRALSSIPWGMTAHIVYKAIDPAAPATLSQKVIAEVVRHDIGFDGVLISDDVSMGALGGRLGDRTRQALAAGCDLALHCNGDPGEMEEVVAAARPISPGTAARLRRGEAMRCGSAVADFDRRQAEAQFDALLAGAAKSESA
jgi:beta-N-acetylhexosaminidase